MENISAIFGYTLKQHLRHRIFTSVILFGLVLMLGALVVSALSTGRVRVVMDLGLSAIELLALVTVIFSTVNLVLEEIESRTIYLLLTHPLSREEYLAGRYLGTVFSVVLSMLAMALMHLAVLFLAGWRWDIFYPVALLCSAGKVMVVSAVALLFSLFSTSAVSALSFTVLAWVLGHFARELKFLGEKSGNAAVRVVTLAVASITPNFSYYDYRDFHTAASLPGAQWFAWLAAYTAAYVFVCLLLSDFLVSQKEF